MVLIIKHIGLFKYFLKTSLGGKFSWKNDIGRLSVFGERLLQKYRTYELGHSISYKKFLQDCMCAQRRLRLECASPQAVRNLFGQTENALDPMLLTECSEGTLV